jgi:hypothetical protein
VPSPEVLKRLAAQAVCGVPAIAGDIGFADAGGLLELHPAIDGTWRDAAAFVDRATRRRSWIGFSRARRRARCRPITTVAERDIVVNQKTAEALGLTLPERFTATATRVIR